MAVLSCIKEELWPSPVICAACERPVHPADMAVKGACMNCWYSESDSVQDAAWEVKDRRPETLKEYRERMTAAGFPYAHLNEGKLHRLEALGNEQATRELKRRDEVYRRLGQG